MTVRVRAGKKVSEDIHTISITSEAEKFSFGNTKIRFYVADNETHYFRMSTWEMTQNLVEKKDVCGSIYLMWIIAGGHMTFKFDLKVAAQWPGRPYTQTFWYMLYFKNV